MVSLFIMKQEVAQILSKIFIVYYKIRYGNRVSFGKNILVNHKFKLQGQGKLIIDNGCNLWAHEEPNKFFFYSHNAEITIGEGSQLNGVTIHCLEKVSLGNSCLVGSAVWLCGQCVLLKGSSVGNNSVVGFRAVVIKSFPTNVVVAGNPARIVKSK